jgi:3-phenylpropionate/trans-cinnamate dioxygenase ferredoxin reductase component
MINRVVVVGAGHAAGQFSARLRTEGFDGELVLLGDEPVVPYQRPPLSKAYLSGEVNLDRVLLRKPEFYAEQNVDIRLSTRVDAVDRDAKKVTLEGGESLEYGQLVFATGARVRKLNLPGFDLPGVHYVRNLADSDGLRDRLADGQRVVVVGGGYIGLEVAAIAAKQGATVTVLEAQDRILARVATAPIAEHLTAVHQSHGVTVRTGVSIASAAGNGAVTGLVLGDGEVVDADTVVVGIGVMPNTEVAEAAGLAVNDGIVVDARGATADANVWAIGDCTRHPSRIYGRDVRLESVHNAMSQARVVAANVAGKDMSYDELPWFWSDQYDLKLQIAGLADGHDATVVRGDPSTGSFTVFAMANGCVIAADSINAMRDHMECRKIAAAQKTVDLSRLADIQVALKEL